MSPCSDRGRSERTWVAFLYILVEAWKSESMDAVRTLLASMISLENLESLLRQGSLDGSLAKMKETRHYMCHRDKREYWDLGRLGIAGQLAFHEKLHMAYSDIFLAVSRVSDMNKPIG